MSLQRSSLAVAALLVTMAAPSDAAAEEKPLNDKHVAALVVVLGCTLLIVVSCAYHFHHGSSKHLACVWSVELEDGKWYSYDHKTATAIEFQQMFGFSRSDKLGISPTNPPFDVAYHDVQEGTIELDLTHMVENSRTLSGGIAGERSRKIRRDGSSAHGKSIGSSDVEQQTAESKSVTPEDAQLNTMLKVLVAVALIVITIVLYTSFA